MKTATAKPCTRPTKTDPGLSAADHLALMELEGKLDLVRDKTVEVVEGLINGILLYGEGGCGKSYAVLSALEQMGANYKHYNSRMTGRGLFDRLQEFPGAIHVLEDMEQIALERNAQGVLRSALWGQRNGDRQERLVTWNAHKLNLSFVFTGGIIMTANCAAADSPQLRALATRIDVLHHAVSNQEIAALMRSVCSSGYSYMGRRLEPGECREVCEYLIEQFRKLERNLNMRLLMTSFSDYMLWQEGNSHHHWTRLVESRLREQVVVPPGEPQETREARKQRERQVAAGVREAAPDDGAKQIALWHARTGKGKSAYYRRLEELGGG